ncbi:hypothetical protein AOA80_03890 [Methanomassiliicoccales archaeon RumEn M1]|jgi:hypothetical protein|nr:hypothetical protein AOA80_03890 [Methanomassiliicoccales archaeon RumEn M1]
MSKKEMEVRDETLNLEELTIAIRNSYSRDMPEEEAEAMARHVLNFFGYSERIIDNVLEPEDRDAFYQLEDNGILTTEREETTLYDGREWRIHYWLFRKDRINELISAESTHMDEMDCEENPYANLDPELWKRAV